MKAHVFICTNHHPEKETCGAKGAQALRDNLKKRFKDDKTIDSSQVRINSAGCLGKCAEGIACVIYPEGEWITRVSESDELKLFELIKKKL
jgi:NADH:ubiquinone oxidoreductase subunit E